MTVATFDDRSDNSADDPCPVVSAAVAVAVVVDDAVAVVVADAVARGRGGQSRKVVFHAVNPCIQFAQQPMNVAGISINMT